MAAKLTNPVSVSWYLSVIFLLGLLLSSAITVVPGGEAFVNVTMLVCLACALLFSAIALCLRHRTRRGLDLGVFGSRPVCIGYAVLALVVTVFLFMAAGG
jgi:ABC-type uncharacterized transport system permease subunit